MRKGRKEGRLGYVCRDGLVVSGFYHTAEIFRVFISPESVNYNYTVSETIIY